MESQMAHPQGQSHEHEPHIVGHHTVDEGGDEHHHGTKWVMGKMKAQAKKIKDSLTKHSPGDNHDHIPDDHDLDKEEDEEEEIVEDPEIHVYETAAIKSAGRVENSGQSGVNAGRSTAMDVDPLPIGQNMKPGGGSHVHGQEERKGQPHVNLGLTSVLGEVPNAPQSTPVSYTAPETHHTRNDEPTRTFVPGQEEHPGEPKVNLQRPKGSEEDPAAPKDGPGACISSNYQSKVTDPTGGGGEEVGITSVRRSLDKMNIHGESKSKSGQEQNWPTGTEDFSASVPTGSHDQFSPELTPPKPFSAEETLDSTRTQEQPHDNTADRQPSQSSYTQKISSAATAIADKAISAKNVVASKLGYGEKDNAGGHEMHGGDKSSTPASAADYGKKIAATETEKLTPVYEKVAGAGSTVMSKMPGTNTGTGSQKERGVEGKNKGVSVKDYFVEKLRPGEEDRALSDVISEALHKKKAQQENKSTTSRPVTEMISDTSHKQEEEPDQATNKPMGTVTESEEVARRLGPTEHDSSSEKMASIYPDKSGKGVVGKIKGAVGSWFSKGDDTHGPQQSFNSAAGSALEEAGNNSSSSAGERRLQESGN
ncbi:low-temperature-induced 65 kDa protein-like [Melia azedarach]|uniref:Low-temperature-induced 65 kDa protein-like n=1 Tax=Melia azedarach TaxID=155640 RepID=A0ACC1X3I8_MELAZ|nr:low-temperature-induced 65 kDa protein-like [Melia azedarach]